MTDNAPQGNPNDPTQQRGGNGPKPSTPTDAVPEAPAETPVENAPGASPSPSDSSGTDGYHEVAEGVQGRVSTDAERAERASAAASAAGSQN